jgi:hypothetical protein
MAAPSTIRVIPWSSKYLEFFDLVSPTWSPPSTMRTVANARRDRLTVEATFTGPDGAVYRLVSRMRKRPDGQWLGVQETLRHRSVYRLPQVQP